MGLDAFGYGVLMTGFAAGAIVGTVLGAGAERRLGRSNVLFLTVSATSAAMLVPALTANPLAVFAALVVAGAMMMMVEHHHRLAAPAHHARPSAGPRQRQLPPLRLGGRCPSAPSWGASSAEAFGIVSVFVVAGLANLALLAFRVVLTDAAIDAAELPPELRQAPEAA